MDDDLPEREAQVYMAKLAQQAERYDEMAAYMRAACMFGQELDAAERNHLSVAYKQSVGQRRAAWRTVCTMEQGMIQKGDHMATASAAAYRKEIERELREISQEILSLLRDVLIPKATSAAAEVLFFKSMGDYHRYIAEISDGPERTNETASAKKAYEEGTRIAENSLAVTNVVRLGLALNHAVFQYEVMQDFKNAITIGRKAFEDAVREIDQMGDENVHESALVMQLLRDNLTLWASDTND